MKNSKAVIIGLIVVLVALFGIAYLINNSGDGEVRGELGERSDLELVRAYLDVNIANLAHTALVNEVLGGTFYVTDLEVDNGNGIVYFEDGHIAFAANFRYTIDEDGNVSITNFVVRNNEDATNPSSADILK